MWVYIGIGMYVGIALAVLAMLTYIWLGDMRRARRHGAAARRRLVLLYTFLLVMAGAWPIGLTSIWFRSTFQGQQAREAKHPAG